MAQDYFYNHGDDPAMKKFIQIAQDNYQEGAILQRRTYFIDKGVRFLLARNWDDLLQRDFKAFTFPRAFAIFTLHTMALSTSTTK